MVLGIPRSIPEKPENPTSPPAEKANGVLPAKAAVTKIRADSIRHREIENPRGAETGSLVRAEKTGVLVRKILGASTGKEALATIRGSFPFEDPTESYAAFLSAMRTEFASTSKKDSPFLWEALRAEPEFETAVIRYLKETVPTIFKNKYSRSLYEDIEYALFLLGSPKNFDVLEDIRLESMKGISGLFARRHSAITRELSAVQTLRASGAAIEAVEERVQSFDRQVSAFEQLCEIINKIAAMQSISALDKDRALSLIRMIAAQIEAVGNELEGTSPDPLAQGKLRFIEGKLLGNYSHLEFFDGKTADEILRNAERICENIELGFQLQKFTGFGGVPEREEIANRVKLGNLAHVWLTAIAKIRKIQPLDERLLELERKWLDVLFKLYSKVSGSGREFTDVAEVAVDFVRQEDHEEFMIETVHHLLLFGEVSEETLFRVATKLIKDDQYHNAYHEEFKIKLFSVIIEKFRGLERSEKTAKVALWIREYARTHEKASGLVLSFSQLYISLAAYFASLPGKASRENAMECYLRASRVTDQSWKAKFEGHEAEFLRLIGGNEKLKEFEEYHSLKMERDIHARLLKLIGDTIRGGSDFDAYRAACEIVEEFFFGMCSAQIKACGCELSEFGLSTTDCAKTSCVPKDSGGGVLRGNGHAPVPLGYGHYLSLQYPANLEKAFSRIFGQHREFIHNNISNLLSIITDRHQLSETNVHLREANERIDRQLRADALTGLPNLRQYEDDLPLFSDIPKVASILIKVENLTEVNGAYGIDTGDKFLKSIVDGPINQFFATNQELWKVYRTSPKEFLIIGDYQENENGIPFSDVVPYFHELFSSFAFFPEAENLGGESRNGLCLRARIAVSYSDQLKTDIYKKLQIAMEETRKGHRVVAYDETHHSERRIIANLKGGALVAEALHGNLFEPHYHGIIDNATGKFTKFESLSRIVKADGTVLSPGAFIDHAEQGGTIPFITRQMFEKNCRALSGTDTHFTININWQDLADPELVAYLREKMERFDIHPSRVTIEILEKAFRKFISGQAEYVGKIIELQRAGCKIALDDFGTESSNFERFKEGWWPDIIKIDGGFIKDLDKSQEDRIIAGAIVASAQKL